MSLRMLARVCVVLSAGAFGCGEGGKSAPSADPKGDAPLGKAADTVDPRPIAAQELTGTVLMDVEGAWGGSPGWLFINGELQGPLPFRKTLLLAPGTCEVRCFSVSRDNPANPGAGPLAGPGFITMVGTAYVERGKTSRNFVPIRTVPSKPLPPFRAVRAVAVYASDAAKREVLEENRRAVQRSWQIFAESEEWRSLTACAATLRANPPARRRAWLKLPDQLGGEREVDPGQMRQIRRWVLDYYAREVGWLEYSEFSQFVKQRRQYVESVLNEILAALEKAPEAP